MKRILSIIPILLLFLSCEKENNEILIGKWRHVKSRNSMSGHVFYPDNQHQKSEEYTKDNIKILYDFEGNEISKCTYSATNSIVTLSGKELNGDTWSLDYKYCFVHDTLKTTTNGGEGDHDVFFIRVN